jgi:hypothetical protein
MVMTVVTVVASRRGKGGGRSQQNQRKNQELFHDG